MCECFYLKNVRDMCSTVENYLILRVFTTGSKIRNFFRTRFEPSFLHIPLNRL